MTEPISPGFLAHIDALLVRERVTRTHPDSPKGEDGVSHRMTDDALVAAAETLTRFEDPAVAARRDGCITASEPGGPVRDLTATSRSLDTMTRHRDLAEAEITGTAPAFGSKRDAAQRTPVTPEQRAGPMTMRMEAREDGSIRLHFHASRRVFGIIALEHGGLVLTDTMDDRTLVRPVIGSIVRDALAAVDACLRGRAIPRAEMDEAVRRLSAISDCGSPRAADSRRYAFLPFAVRETIVADDTRDDQGRVALDEDQRRLLAKVDAALGRVVRVTTGFHSPTPMLFDLDIRHVAVGLPPSSTAETMRIMTEVEAMPDPTDLDGDETA